MSSILNSLLQQQQLQQDQEDQNYDEGRRFDHDREIATTINTSTVNNNNDTISTRERKRRRRQQQQRSRSSLLNTSGHRKKNISSSSSSSSSNDAVKEYADDEQDEVAEEEEEEEVVEFNFESILNRGGNDDSDKNGRSREDDSKMDGIKRRRIASGTKVSEDPFYQMFPNTLRALYEYEHDSADDNDDNDGRAATKDSSDSSSAPYNQNDENYDDDGDDDNAVDDDDNDDNEGKEADQISSSAKDVSDTRRRNHKTNKRTLNSKTKRRIQDGHERLEIIEKALHPRPIELLVADENDVVINEDGINDGVNAAMAAIAALDDQDCGGGNDGDGDGDTTKAGDGDGDELSMRQKVDQNALIGVVGSSTKQSRSKIGRYQPRRKRYFVPKTAELKASGSIPNGPGANYALYRYEKPKEIQERVESLERSEEIWSRHMRWKRRKINLQDEQDVGQVFAARADAYLKDQLIKEQKEHKIIQRTIDRKRKREEKERQREEEVRRKQQQEEQHRQQEEQDKLEDDDSLHEQNHLLSQLTENSGTVAGGSRTMSSMGGSINSNVDTKKLTYWEDGYAKPFKEDIDYNFNPSIDLIIKHKSNQRIVGNSDEILDDDDNNDHHNENGAVTAPVVKLMTNVCTSHPNFHYYVTPNRMQHSRLGYTAYHIRQMMVLAARSLCGHPDLRSKNRNGHYLEDRYINLLMSSSTVSTYREKWKNRQVDKVGLVTYTKDHFMELYTKEAGKNLLLYINNTWSNTMGAVQKLGLIDSIESPNPAARMTISSFFNSNKSIRSKVRKALRLSSREWSHDDSLLKNVESGMSAGQNDHEGSASNATTTDCAVPDGPTSDGIAKLSSRLSNNMVDESIFSRVVDDSKDLLVSPNSFWAHVQGTSPPIPPRPLDPLEILFGPSDRYSKFYRGNARISLNSFNLILSTLMQRASMRLYNSKRMAETQEQIMSLIYEFIHVHTTELFIRLDKYSSASKTNDIPLVYLYHGLMSFCSFMASGCPSLETTFSDGNDPFNSDGDLPIKEEEIDKNDDDSDDGSSNRNQESSSISSQRGRVRLLHDEGMNKVAERIWDYCRVKISINGILRFPRPRVIFAIASICKSLPPAAAEILSRPLDENTTPLDLFKDTLSHIEAKKMIHQTNDYVDDESIHVGALEYILHEATDTFNEAVRLDCLNSDYHLWHIGCLASCLILSSGNRIGDDRASAFPSQRTKDDDLPGASHEIRKRLKKYTDVRCELSAAVSLLLDLTNHQQSSRTHFAVASLLEWSQVVALLVGGSLEKNLDSILGVHRYHIRQWSQKETPKATISLPEKTRQMVSDLRLYARQLENDPVDVDHWRDFIRHLGPIKNPESQHGSQMTSERNAEWWGYGRKWWLTSLLYIDEVGDLSIKEKQGNIVRLEELTSTFGGTSDETDDDHALPLSLDQMDNNNTTRLSVDDMRKEWLPSVSKIVSENIGDGTTNRERSKCFLKHLPQSILSSKRRAGISTADIENDRQFHDRTTIEDTDISFYQSVSLDVELLAYKILVAIKLDGINNDVVLNGLYTLATTLDGSDCIAAIVWLASKGLDVSSIRRNDKQ